MCYETFYVILQQVIYAIFKVSSLFKAGALTWDPRPPDLPVNKAVQKCPPAMITPVLGICQDSRGFQSTVAIRGPSQGGRCCDSVEDVLTVGVSWANKVTFYFDRCSW